MAANLDALRFRRCVLRLADHFAALRPKPRHRHPAITVCWIGVPFRELAALSGVGFVTVHQQCPNLVVKREPAHASRAQAPKGAMLGGHPERR
jgi:hypothetical protein